MLRLFVALGLPDEIRDRLEELEEPLPGARWVPYENFHITLRFIGEVDGGLARDIDAALEGVDGRGFELTLKGLGLFGDGRKVRALWAGVEANESLLRLQLKVEQALQRSGLEPEGRKYKPHITLARFKQPPGEKLDHYLARRALFRTPPFTVRAFTLYRSFLSGEGSIYRAEANYGLELPAPLLKGVAAAS